MQRAGRHLATCVAALGFVASTGSAVAADSDGRLYELPQPGSYDLPVIDRVARHELLDADGEPSFLPGTEADQCAVVSFIYSSCPDAQGCPLLLSTLRRLDRALAADGVLAQRVRLVSVSFDPQHDTPERLKMLRTHMNPSTDWRFLTADSGPALQPILDDYGQDALRLVAAENGASTALIRHVAKVFLVDGSGGIRNVYSSGFLDYEILMRDIETLLLADEASPDHSRDGP